MMRFLVRKATSVGIVPALQGFTRPYSAGPSLPPEGKLATSMIDQANIAMCLGVSVTAIANFLYRMDFDGRWARRAVDNKKRRELYALEIESLKRNRERLEAFVRKRRPKAEEETSG